MDEDVLPAVYGDEAVALLVVEPLHGALCHVHSLLGAIRPRVLRGRGLRSSAPINFSARRPGSGHRGSSSCETPGTTTNAESTRKAAQMATGRSHLVIQ